MNKLLLASVLAGGLFVPEVAGPAQASHPYYGSVGSFGLGLGYYGGHGYGGGGYSYGGHGGGH